MQRPSTFRPYQQTSSSPRPTQGAADFLRAHDKMAALLPSITRMVALQKACAVALPAMFAACTVSQFDASQLVLSVPNAALASKLRQQLPKLQEQLLVQGWQVNSIRLKVQVVQTMPRATPVAPPLLPPIATTAFAQLEQALPDSPRNQALKAAIAAMVRRQRQ